MNRSLLLLFFGCLCGYSPATAQSLSLDRSVVASSGFSAVRSGLRYDYTIGEALIAPLSLPSGQLHLSSGFQQPDRKTTVSLEDPVSRQQFVVTLFPNPSTEVLHVVFENSPPEAGVWIEVVNVLGQVVSKSAFFALPAGTPSTLEVGHLPRGQYFLHFRTAQGQHIGTAAFVAV